MRVRGTATSVAPLDGEDEFSRSDDSNHSAAGGRAPFEWVEPNAVRQKMHGLGGGESSWPVQLIGELPLEQVGRDAGRLMVSAARCSTIDHIDRSDQFALGQRLDLEVPAACRGFGGRQLRRAFARVQIDRATQARRLRSNFESFDPSQDQFGPGLLNRQGDAVAIRRF
jgi:hypothetical protein